VRIVPSGITFEENVEKELGIGRSEGEGKGFLNWNQDGSSVFLAERRCSGKCVPLFRIHG